MEKLLFELINRSPIWAVLPRGLFLHLSTTHFEGTIDAPKWEAAKPVITGKGPNRTALIPVQGVLTKDGPACYGSSYDGITSALESAALDSTVKRIVLRVDSPGGEVTGLPETAALLASIAKQKPVHAIVEGTSASAAYWLTSQANSVTLTPSGEVGSVGVRMMHVDMSKMLDEAGFKITEMQAGAFKTEWSPYKPLTDEAKADMQSRLDSVHTDFLDAVATGRVGRVSQDMAGNRMGEGRMFSGKDALTHGLVDKLQATNEFYRAILPASEEETSAPAFGFPRSQAIAIKRRRLLPG